jgi:hypothetical protein
MVKFAQGAIAQLGERVNGIHEVGSSILPGSTNLYFSPSPNRLVRKSHSGHDNGVMRANIPQRVS